MTIEKIHSLLKSRKLSSVDLLNLFRARIEKENWKINAFVEVMEDKAFQQACKSEQRYARNAPLGELDGIPFIVKDNFCTEHSYTSCASHILKSFRPPYTATVVDRLMAQGAVLLGKGNMDEFAMGSSCIDSIFGPVKNPWSWKSDVSLGEDSDAFRVAGGSSGGSAAAVSDGLAVVGFGSDTGGSTRIPASFCGIVGLKPSYGLLSRHGLIPLVNILDQPGIFSWGVDDSWKVYRRVAGPDALDSTMLPPKQFQMVHPESDPCVTTIKIGIPKEYHIRGTNADIVAAWERVAGWLSDCGCSVTPVSLPHTQYSVKCYTVLCSAEVASNMARFDGVEFGHRAENVEETTDALYAATRFEGFQTVVRSRILAGNYFLLLKHIDRYFHKAQKIWRLIVNDFHRVFHEGGVDVLLFPVTPFDAPLYSEFVVQSRRKTTEQIDLFSQAVNLAGLPALSLPICLSGNKLPIALQIVGPRYSEQTVFALAKWIENRAQFKPLFQFDSLLQQNSSM